MLEVVGVFEGWNAYDLTPFEADHARFDDHFRLELRPPGHVHVLAGVELSLHDARGNNLEVNASTAGLRGQKMEERKEERFSGDVHSTLGQVRILGGRGGGKERREADDGCFS